MSSLSRDPEALVGRTLGEKYRLTGLVGKGGFGAVYRAVQDPVGREVAVKVIGRVGDDHGLRTRFFREAQVLARLKDPATVTLFDYGEEPDGTLYMVQELVIGRPLSAVLARGARLEPQRAVRIVMQILHALEEAHGLGVVHRDIKPANIMVTQGREGDEAVRVLDFGVAKLLVDPSDGYRTTRGHTVGTPTYMAPEQTRAKGIGPATDLYALGILLYRMLTGQLPYKADSHFETMMMHRKAPLPAMEGIPPAIAEVIGTALAKKSADRHADARAMRKALEAAFPGAAMPSDTHPAPASAPPDGPTIATPAALPTRPDTPSAPPADTTPSATATDPPPTAQGPDPRLLYAVIALLAAALIAALVW